MILWSRSLHDGLAPFLCFQQICFMANSYMTDFNIAHTSANQIGRGLSKPFGLLDFLPSHSLYAEWQLRFDDLVTKCSVESFLLMGPQRRPLFAHPRSK